MAGWLALAFGGVLIGIAVGSLLRERRRAGRRPRERNEDLSASTGLLLVLGGAAVLLGLAVLLVFPRG